MHSTRLSGWQRLWVVASVMYAIPVIWLTHLQLGDVPGEPYEKRQWAYGAGELLADYVGVTTRSCNCDILKYLFATHDNDEAIKRIYSIPLAYRTHSASTGTEKDPEDIEKDCKQEPKKRNDSAESQPTKGFQMKSLEELGFPLGMGAENVSQCKLSVLKRMIESGRLFDLNNFSVQELETQLGELEKDYKARITQASRDWFVSVGIGFLAWLLPIVAVYVLGLAAGWVYRGFRESR